MKLATPKVATTIAKRIVQRKGSVLPLLSRYVTKRVLGAKFSLISKRLTTMKNGQMDSTAKVAPEPAPHFAVTDLFKDQGD